MKLEGTVSIITGSAQGIGKAFAKALLLKGGKVCISDVNEEIGQQTLAEFQQDHGQDVCAFFKCDVTDKNSVKDLFKYAKESFGKIDIVCNNAGIGIEDFDSFHKTIEINLTAMITGSKLAVDEFQKSGGGVIINVASAGGLQPLPTAPVYSASKHGIIGYSKSLALAPGIKEGKIRVNVMCPSFVRTALLAAGGDAVVKRIEEIGGLMEPEFIAEGFMELIEDDTKHGAVMLLTKDKGIVYL